MSRYFDYCLVRLASARLRLVEVARHTEFELKLLVEFASSLVRWLNSILRTLVDSAAKAGSGRHGRSVSENSRLNLVTPLAN
jgi:hypothetical protein